MKGLVKYGAGEGNMEIREVAEPSPGPGQVKIAVKATGICGSDIHVYHGTIGIPMRYPVVTGHELAGEIAELGEGVEGLQVGQKVTSETTFSSCGQCRYCRQGSEYLCSERRTLGYWVNGAFAPYTIVPAKRIHLLPDDVDPTVACVVEPLAYCAHSVLERTGIEVNDWVLVTGPGPIGLLSALVAKAAGARVVLVGTGSDANRLALADKVGIDRTVNLAKDDPLKVAHEVAGAYGFDVFLECSGSPQAVKMGLDLVRPEGKYTQSGHFSQPFVMDLEPIIYKEIRTTGAYAHKWSAWEKAIELFTTGRVPLASLVAEVSPVTDWEGAFARQRGASAGKIVLTPVE